ncbi:flagellar basal body rod protein FlgB [Thiomicrorhabdus lithotrophica]|uniref:Flagellar basal body rod protein FlgB n=1 Tax=Thiomicrorhabdus lithotrophica TaxID=2949997 RepID=A0ABY8CFT6_9GAMM|nr:flagellar basal body rod protein FlgB [Thiomicrorhabdus lithotrophica]WEJ63346.1 flagellar basal body rod protein FlgB [Thiomicrorhabdus lithotrophica]
MAESIFGIHEQALRVRTKRAEVLANNLANADTPSFKAKDIDFRKALQDASGEMKNSYQTEMRKTNPGHIDGDSNGFSSTSQYLMYRQPTQPSLDGNTVETHIEKVQFMENAMQQQATLEFIDGKISSIRSAIQGQ